MKQPGCVARMIWFVGALSITVPWGAAAQPLRLPPVGVVPPALETPPEAPEALRYFAPLFFPKMLSDVYRLREYIRDAAFASLRRSYGDLFAVDAIFARALSLSWNNVYEALLISLAATMDHDRVGVRLPLLGPLLWFPLTSEFAEEFGERVNALPSSLYADTPPGRGGDRDKLQHFFGSAFLAYAFASGDVAERVGAFVEWGEDRFIVGGVLDERDLRANRQGQRFGLRLLSDGSARPSLFLLSPGRERPRDESPLPLPAAGLDSLCSVLEDR